MSITKSTITKCDWCGTKPATRKTPGCANCGNPGAALHICDAILCWKASQLPYGAACSVCDKEENL